MAPPFSEAPRPKIVFVNRYFYPDQSATSQLLTDLTRALAASGRVVHVICSRQRYDDASHRLTPRESVSGVQVHRVLTSRFGRRFLIGRALDYATFYLTSALAMIRILRRGDSVVAETDPPLISIVVMLVARLTGAQQINWLQDIFPEVASLLHANPLPWALDVCLRRCRDLSLRAAHTNVVLGERMSEKVKDAGVRPDSIEIIENWAEARPAAPKPQASSALRAKLGLGDRFVVGYSGNLGRAHEFQTMLHAAESLRADARFAFLMIGGGVGMRQIAREVSERQLANFRFLDYQPREALADGLAAADLHWVSLRPELEGLVVPSKFYGILAAARPVIFIGDVDGELARAIRKCGCGASVEVGDSDELVRLMTAWQADSELLARMGEAGYQRYCERYSAERAFRQWSRILTPKRRLDGVLPPALSSR